MAEKGVIMNIASHVERLIESHGVLSRSCAQLTAQRDALQDENRALKMRVRELETQLSKLRLSDGLSGGAADREGARARINRLLREVDRCIALLGGED
ncbi:MAG: hypothetical protein J1D86_07765 [Alistipes sp.]|nr:hypothetical protein [Alistipes sp.]